MQMEMPYESTHVATTWLMLGAFATLLLKNPTEVAAWGFQQ
jgi:hypothetical protein